MLSVGALVKQGTQDIVLFNSDKVQNEGTLVENTRCGRALPLHLSDDVKVRKINIFNQGLSGWVARGEEFRQGRSFLYRMPDIYKLG